MTAVVTATTRRLRLRGLLVLRQPPLAGHGPPASSSSTTRRRCMASRRASSSSSSPSSPSPTATTQVPLLRRFFNGYLQLLDTFPLVTKMVTSGIIAASGDLVCQCCFAVDDLTDIHDGPPQDEDRDDKASDAATTAAVKGGGPSVPQGKDETKNSVPSAKRSATSSSWAWDAERTGRFGVLGAFLVAPAVHHWYNALHRWTANSTSTATRRGGLQLLAARVAFDQLMFAPAFTAAWLLSLRTLEGRHYSSWERLWDDVPQIVVANWALWIPAQCVNFAMVPLKFQVLFSNVVALAWNVYLSYQTSRHSSRRRTNNYIKNDNES